MQYAYPVDIADDPAEGWTVVFPDLPEAITGAASRAEALALAEDYLDTAFGARVTAGEPIPAPSPARGRPRIAPTPTVALKAALYVAIRRDEVTQRRLALALGKSDRIVRRLLDPRHPSKLTELQAALAALRLAVRVEVGPVGAP